MPIDIVLARVLHVLAFVIWIGGVSMVTTVALPAVRRGNLGAALEAFAAIEVRFIWQARVAVILTGLTGFYITCRLELWDRFRLDRFHIEAFWWMHAMICLWLLFATLLFIAEPFFFHRTFHRWAAKQPGAAFAWLNRAHWVLLLLSLVTIMGAVAGSQGVSSF